MPSRRLLPLPAVACAAIFLLAEWVSRPWAETGVSDDWSYIRTSQLLAQTGHIHYVGWAEAIVGWQFYLAAAAIRLLGFSFTHARLPSFLIAAATVYLAQRTMVRLGLNQTSACLGVLTLALSPLFLSLSATMMTDVPGLFATVLCSYGCLRALQSPTDRAAILWLWFAVASNALCGTSRPTAWLGIFAIVPAALWLLRARRRVLLAGMAALFAGFVSVLLVMHWFRHQPYFIDTYASLPSVVPHFGAQLAAQCIQSVQICAFLLLPVLLAFPLLAPRWPRAVTATATGLVLIWLYAAQHLAGLRFLSSPFWGEWINLYGVYQGNSLPGRPPVLIGRAPHILADILVVASILATAITLALYRRAPARGRQEEIDWTRALVLLVPVSVCTIVLLVLRVKIVGFVYERYFLNLLFCALLLLLLYYQDVIRRPLPVLCFAFVAIWGVYGIVSTHNMFAFYRARAAIAQELIAAGVAPSSVDFGWEQDGWYELQQSAYVNNVNIATPGAFHPANHHTGDACHDPAPIGANLHLAPRYGIAFQPDLCDGPAPFTPVPYATWGIHPQPALYVFRYPPPWYSEIDAGVPAPPPPLR